MKFSEFVEYQRNEVKEETIREVAYDEKVNLTYFEYYLYETGENDLDIAITIANYFGYDIVLKDKDGNEIKLDFQNQKLEAE